MGWWLDRRRSETGGGASRARGRMGQHQSHREKMCLFSTYAKLDFLVFLLLAHAFRNSGDYRAGDVVKVCDMRKPLVQSSSCCSVGDC